MYFLHRAPPAKRGAGRAGRRPADCCRGGRCYGRGCQGDSMCTHFPPRFPRRDDVEGGLPRGPEGSAFGGSPRSLPTSLTPGTAGAPWPPSAAPGPAGEWPPASPWCEQTILCSATALLLGSLSCSSSLPTRHSTSLSLCFRICQMDLMMLTSQGRWGNRT